MPYLEKQDQIWAKIFCISKNMHSRTPMVVTAQQRLRLIFTIAAANHLGACSPYAGGMFQRWPRIQNARVDSDRILRCFRTRILDRSQKFVENRTRSHFIISAVAGAYVVFINAISQVKTLNVGCLDGYRSFCKSRVLKFETFLDPDSKISQQERNRSLKMRIWPPLVCQYDS